MAVAARVLKNTISLSMVRIINPVVSFFLIVFIARYRDVSFLGNYSLILAFYSIFVMVSCLGFETLIVRDLSKEKWKASKYMFNGSAIMFSSGLVFALVLCLIANLFRYEIEVKTALCVGSAVLIPSSISALCRGLFKAHEKNGYITIAEVSQNTLRVVLSIIALYLGFGLLGLVTASLAAAVFGLLMAFYFIKDRLLIPFKFGIDIQFCKKLVKTSITFALISVVVSFYWQAGIIILSKIKGPEAVGIFSAAVRVFLIIEAFIVAFGVSVFPIISQRYEMQGSGFERTSINSARYIVSLILFVAVAVTFLSEDIIQLLYGIKFKESVFVLSLLVWALVPFSLVTVFAYSLFSSYNQRIDLTINSIGLMSNVILNLLLVPKFSYLGTGLALLGSTCILHICQYIFINKNLFTFKLTRILGAPSLSSAVIVLFIIMLRSKINLYLLLGASTLLYPFALYFFGGFEENEKAYLKEVPARLIQFWKFSLLR